MNFPFRWWKHISFKRKKHSENWTKTCVPFLIIILSLLDLTLSIPFLTSSTDKNLIELSKLGHFLKGSSAAIGLGKVQASCQKIQHYGDQRDEEAKKDLEPEEALDKITNQLAQLREEYIEAKQTLEDWFCEHEDEDKREVE